MRHGERRINDEKKKILQINSTALDLCGKLKTRYPHTECVVGWSFNASLMKCNFFQISSIFFSSFYFLIYTHHVSRFENFFVTTFPRSIPNRSTIRCAKSGWLVPLKTLMFGIIWHCLSVESRKGFEVNLQHKTWHKHCLVTQRIVACPSSTLWWCRNFRIISHPISDKINIFCKKQKKWLTWPFLESKESLRRC